MKLFNSTIAISVLMSAFSVASEAQDLPPNLLEKKTLANGLCPFSRPALGDDGNFYMALADGGCGAATPGPRGAASLDSTGNLRWGTVIPSGCSAFGSTGLSVSASGTVFGVGDWNSCRNGRLVALNSLDGGIQYDHGDCPGGGNTSPHPRQVPAINEDLNAVHFGSSQLCSVDIDTGINNWAVSGGRYIGGQGIVLDETGNITYVTYDGSTSEASSYSSNGTPRWSKSRAYSSQGHYEVVGLTSTGDVLLQITRVNPTLELHSSTGTLVWSRSNLHYPVVGTGDRIYAGSPAGNDIVALDATNTELWRSNIGTGPSSRVDFIDADGVLYVRSGNEVFAVDSQTGSVDWSYTADNPLLTELALNAEGKLFFIDSAGESYLFDSCSNYMPSTWPVARFGNERHTGMAGPFESSITDCAGAAPLLHLSDDQIDFPDQTINTQSDPRNIVISNSGPADLELGIVRKVGADTSSFFLNTTGCSNITLPPGGECTISVLFEPSSTGVLNAEIEIQSNDIGSPNFVALQGRGVSDIPEYVDLNFDPLSLPNQPLKLGKKQSATLLLLDILSDEYTGILTYPGQPQDYRFQNDACYWGAVSAARNEAAKNFTAQSLKALGGAVFKEFIGGVGTGSIWGDIALKFTVSAASGYLSGEEWQVSVLSAIAEQSMGYIAPALVNKYQLSPTTGYAAEELTAKVVSKALKDDAIVSASMFGENLPADSPYSDGSPYTQVSVNWFYSPQTHYVTAFINADCGADGNGGYLYRFQIEKSAHGQGVSLVPGTLRILKIGE